MSDRLGLGQADAESRWIGVRRHQAIIVIAGLGLLGSWLIDSRAPVVQALVGVSCLVGAAPTKDGLTIAERGLIALHFVGRSRWTSIQCRVRANVMTIDACGKVQLRGFELTHRGRLDLSDRGHDIATGLASFADTLATSDTTRHFSLHVIVRGDDVSTLLALPDGVSAPSGWSLNTSLVSKCVGSHTLGWMLERWTYLRLSDEVVRVLRIRDFSSVREGQALLERVQFASPWSDVSFHVDVLAGAHAQRITARAVHRVRSDDAATQAAGFRRTARSVRSLERLGEREALVLEGRALLHLAIFVVIRAASVAALEGECSSVTRQTLEAGLRVEPGYGRQASWYCAQLPGGPGW